jgi:hypothetical protein
MLTCGREKQIHAHRELTNAGQNTVKCDIYGNGGDKDSENNRVRESPMTPKVTVSDAKMESNHIKIRHNTTESTNRPDSLWNTRRVTAGSNAESSYRM